MIASKSTPPREAASVALMDIGNATVALGTWRSGSVSDTRSIPIDQSREIEATLKVFATQAPQGVLTGVAIASVVPEALARFCRWIEEHLTLAPLVVGRHIPLPIEVKLDAPEDVGVDRICSAAAAFDKQRQACVIVDCGTAVTVDVVDDNGAFIGGAILPGLRMQAQSLHQHTAVLPAVTPAEPEATIGGDTAGAIRSGIYHGTAGAVRGIVEAYATHFNRWPVVVATGGDAEMIAKPCGVFDAIVPDLCLLGVGLAYDKRLLQAVTL